MQTQIRQPRPVRSTLHRWTFKLAAAAWLAGANFGIGPVAAQTVDLSVAKPTAGSSVTINHDSWDRQTKTYVVAGPDGLNRVRYAAWKAEKHADLKRYIASLEAADIAALDAREQFAFWANLYNAKTIDIVLDKYPVKSIKDINLGGSLLSALTGGPWKAKVVKVAGRELSLDDIEHNILRATFKDPRVHFALNCASIGCPNLMAGAYNGADLEKQLDLGGRAFINHSRGIKVDSGKVYASSIFTWFEADFGGSPAAVLAFARKYSDPALKQKLAGVTVIAGYDYDWGLNDAD